MGLGGHELRGCMIDVGEGVLEGGCGRYLRICLWVSVFILSIA